MEDFDAGDGLHGLPINRTDDAGKTGKSSVLHKNTEDVKENVDKDQIKDEISTTAHSLLIRS